MAGENANPVSSVNRSFAADTFTLETVKRAAYRFVDRASFDIRTTGDEIVVRLDFAPPIASDEADTLLNEFCNEVLDQDLRRTIAEETAPIRNAILAYAFSRTGLQGE